MSTKGLVNHIGDPAREPGPRLDAGPRGSRGRSLSEPWIPVRVVPKGVFTLSDARSFSGLTSKISPLGSMLNFEANVKKTTALQQCENPNRCTVDIFQGWDGTPLDTTSEAGLHLSSELRPEAKSESVCVH